MDKLTKIKIKCIYNTKDGFLPERMAYCTPDTKKALEDIAIDLKAKGGELVLSDLFRTYDMQHQAHNDFITGKKTAFSPPPGFSFHESGRAFDIDLDKIKIPLSEFWVIAKKYGVVPIIKEPNSSKSEAWHFEKRGSFQLIYDYYLELDLHSNITPYQATASAAILAIDAKVDCFADRCDEAFIQGALIRLGYDTGIIDGYIGKLTRAAIEKCGITATDIKQIKEEIIIQLQLKFPEEFSE